DRYRDADRNGTRTQYLATRAWHFVNVDIDHPDADAACAGHPPLPPGTPASAGPADACIIDKVAQFTAELADRRQPPAERLLALKFTMPLVGDLHQPLHTATRADHGGNDVAVQPGNAAVATDNLHAYWDVHLVAALGPRPAEVAVALDRA